MHDGRAVSSTVGRLATWTTIASALFAYYVGLATHFSFDWWPTTSGGFVFNSQLRALLDLRLDIDPNVIGMEGFVRDGKTYTYFGIWPALLRLPLIGQLWRDWTTLSCITASTLASLTLLLALRSAQRPNDVSRATRCVSAAFALTLMLSGPQIELLGKPSVYVEAIAWAYAFVCTFLWLAVPLLQGAPATARRLTLLAGCASLALLTRVSTGMAMYCALGLLALLLCHGASLRDCFRRWAPAAIVLASAIIISGAVNQARWDSPWQFADLATNRYYGADPARLLRIETLGAFNIARIPQALTYYFAGDAFFAPARDSNAWRTVQRLFDGPEGPPSSLLLTMPLWWLLACVGLYRCIAHPSHVQTRSTVALAAGLAVAPALMMTYVYLAFRYRAEFAPTLLLLSLRGLAWRKGWPMPRLFVPLAFAAAVIQVTQAHSAFREHACSRFGSWHTADHEQCSFTPATSLERNSARASSPPG